MHGQKISEVDLLPVPVFRDQESRTMLKGSWLHITVPKLSSKQEGLVPVTIRGPSNSLLLTEMKKNRLEKLEQPLTICRI